MTNTIGDQLKIAREKQNLTIDDVVKATHILSRHIEAIEADNYEVFPSPVQARAFLRIYAEHLGLSLDNLITQQREGQKLSDPKVPLKTGDSEDLEKEISPATNESDSSQKPNHGFTRSSWKRITRLYTKGKTVLFSWIKFGKGKSNESSETSRQTQVDESVIPEVQKGKSSFQAQEQLTEDKNPATKSKEIKESQAIFTSIGETLKSRRESLSLTLDEVERHTHVRKRYLAALEEGIFDNLPSSVQGRGMLHNYAHFLDMDMDAILLQYAEGLQARRLENQPKPVEEEKPPKRFFPKVNIPPKLRLFLTMDMIVGTGLVIILFILAIWGTGKIIGLSAISTLLPTAPSISDILQTPQGETPSSSIPTITIGIDSIATQSLSTLAISNQAQVSGAVRVTAYILDNVWMKVTVDGKVTFSGRVSPGMVYPFGGNKQIEVLTGSGSAIRILYNQSDLGLMGSPGQVVDRIYTPNSILNPTPTNTPTITITPVPSKTTKPSPTPTPTHTPRFSPTPTH